MPWRLAALNLFRNKARTILTLSAISFGCASLIVSAGFLQDSVTQMKENYIRGFLGHIRVVQKGFFEKGLLEPFEYMIPNSPELIATISDVPGVQAVAPRLEFSGLLSTGESSLPFMAQGVDPEVESQVSMNFRILEGANLSRSDRFTVVLGRGLAEAIGAKAGMQATLLGTTVHGSMNAMDVQVKGIFQTISKTFDDHSIRLLLPEGQKLLRTDKVHTLTVFVRKTEDTDLICKRLREVFMAKHFDLDVRPWHQMPDADFVNKLEPFYAVFFGTLKFIIVMMVVFGIFNTINTSVLERIGEIGTLGAMGTSARGILRLFMAEGLILGLAGALIGVLTGVALGHLISLVGIPMPIAPGTTMRWISHIEIRASACLSAALLVTIATIISTYFPARRASRLDIAEALRHNI